MFEIEKKSTVSEARIGVLQTNHGPLPTPFFMPVATQGAVKHVSTRELETAGARIILSNTYHLMIRPGSALIKKMGGLHRFMDWQMPILTDSGGFQVFSLSADRTKTGRSLVKLSEEGVEFRSYIDGRKLSLTPEQALEIQTDLGVDIAVCLDQCLALPAEKDKVEESVRLTTRWAERTKKHQTKLGKKKGQTAPPLLHAVIQGGLDMDLRRRSLEELVSIGFDGYNIGGLSVGESEDDMYRVIRELAPIMPEDKPRYLMGVGYPHNILSAAISGIDMFDCVIPTREGRHGRLFAWTDPEGKLESASTRSNKSFYKTLWMQGSEYSADKSVINPNSVFSELRNLSRAYLRYLLKIKEPLGMRLATLNNLEFYMDLMAEIRKGVDAGRL